ncbi:MAG TPA: DUF2326 domain-containing protein [Fibrobacteres bacterium]|jgi:uncharacterized protein YydD (DUF2326 family)|nr:DUF2326 domain-containing protein [Fibrobacterota bacterium]
MITRVFANQPSFKPVEFTPGMNIIWADRTKDSTKKDSRNGLGKSTLIEIIHFCLGAKVEKHKGLMVDQLKDWVFSVELSIQNKNIIVSRSVDDPGKVTVKGDFSDWPVQPKEKNGEIVFLVKDWNAILGVLLFGLPVVTDTKGYKPSFRSLISYLIRKGKDSFSIPFEHHRKMFEWDKQINNAYLLGLSWENAAELQKLKDQKKGIQNLKKAAKAGVIKNFIGTLGDLEAQKVRLKAEAEIEASNLKTFKVHPQYNKIQSEANELTAEIHEAVNSSMSSNQILELYENSLNSEQSPPDEEVASLYKEVGITLPDLTFRHLQEVTEFHLNIIENRKQYLSSEIAVLKTTIASIEETIAKKTEKRSSLLEILNTHGALQEYTLLEKRHMQTISQLNAVSSMIDNLKAFQEGLSKIKIEQEQLFQKARRDLDERDIIREKAITLFNSFSEKLYNAPGKLVIDFAEKGFTFDIDIERSGSSGIGNMKIFCYDIMLASLWVEKQTTPRLLVHDSIIFDGVDERQRALALEIASKEAETRGFQYICTLNSDYIPWGEFTEGFDIKKFIRLRLTDEKTEGCLLGVRF